MTAIDTERALRLDRQFDDVLRRRTEDAEMATLHDLAALADRPVPDPTFVRRLREELEGAETEFPDRVIPPPLTVIPHHHVILSGREESRLIGDRTNRRPRSFVPQDDSGFSHDPYPLLSLNGHSHLHSDAMPFRSWWWRWEIAAAILVIAVLGGYLALASLGRTNPPPSRLSAITAQTAGTAPVELRIGAIGIDAPIERRLSVAESTSPGENLWATGWQDGAPVPMAEPGEPFAAAWLDESAAPGEGGNVVLHGHLDYWDTSPALFGNLDELTAGDRIDITGANDTVYSYEVEWSRRFPSHVDEDQQRDILGPTAVESLTLITGAGAYDRETGYRETLVVRAHLVGTERLSVLALPGPADC
jgi:hypothetical protein